MKKMMFFAVLMTGLLFTSCKDACYQCTISNIATVRVDICNDQYTISATGIPTTTNNLPSGTTEKEYAEQLESQGYSCSQK
jgi:hypothetical protein